MKLIKIITMYFCFALLLMNTTCDDDDDSMAPGPCSQAVVIDSGFYESADSNVYELLSAEINENCLSVIISASGCDSGSWSVVLVDSGDVAESSPEQRYLKFVFSNDENCLAVFTQERSFDLRPIQVDGSNEIILNIEDFPDVFTYTY